MNATSVISEFIQMNNLERTVIKVIEATKVTENVDVGNLTVVEKSKDAKPVNGYIYSVNLFGYVDSNAFIIRIYWALFISL